MTIFEVNKLEMMTQQAKKVWARNSVTAEFGTEITYKSGAVHN